MFTSSNSRFDLVFVNLFYPISFLTICLLTMNVLVLIQEEILACYEAENALLECISAYKEVMHFMISQNVFCICIYNVLVGCFNLFLIIYLYYHLVRFPISLISGLCVFFFNSCPLKKLKLATLLMKYDCHQRISLLTVCLVCLVYINKIHITSLLQTRRYLC